MQEYADIFNARGHLYNEASSSCPRARQRERDAVIDRMALRPGQHVLDAPAGGGYLADGIRRRCGGQVDVTCVEPAERFSQAIGTEHIVVVKPLAQTGLPGGSFDAVASLAGLHHIVDRNSVYREWRRLLKPGGRLVVADVQDGTGTGDFLNGFVDQHTPGGHQGVFFTDGELTQRLKECGFGEVTEDLIDVPWHFTSVENMIRFCRQLFAIESAGADETLAALRETVGVDQPEPDCVVLQWQLRVATANLDT